METHVKVLGILNLVSGGLGVCTALFMILIFGGVTGLVGAQGDPDAALAMPIIGAAGVFVVSFILVLSLPSVIVGWGLYTLRPWSRIAGIVISVLSLLAFPLGTVLGVYGLWVLLSGEGQRVFGATA